MTDPKLRNIIIDGVVTYSKSYSDVADADNWYAMQIAKPNFIPEEHTTEDVINPEMYEALWKAATAYQTLYISGAAFGLVTIGVINNRPIANDIQVWLESLWTEYYARKDDIGNATLDFSNVGPMPHSVRELMEE